MPLCYYIIVPREQRKNKNMCVCAVARRQEGEWIMKKYCTRCGKPFEAVGREVICPSCKAQAAEDAKRAAVLKAKRASWNGESVPVRISGRASTLIREYGAEKGLPFAAALDALLKASSFFQTTGKAWEEVEPYKSHRRDKHATETEQDEQEAPQASKQAASKQAAKQAGGKAGREGNNEQGSQDEQGNEQAAGGRKGRK